MDNTDHSKTVENHEKAAAHNEAAAKSHHEAVKHHEAGNHAEAAKITVVANGHHKLADSLQKEIAKHHTLAK